MCDTYARTAHTHTHIVDSTKTRQKIKNKINSHSHRIDIITAMIFKFWFKFKFQIEAYELNKLCTHSIRILLQQQAQSNRHFGLEWVSWCFLLHLFLHWRSHGNPLHKFQMATTTTEIMKHTHDTVYVLPVILHYRQTDRSDEAIKFHAPRQKHLKFHVY